MLLGWVLSVVIFVVLALVLVAILLDWVLSVAIFGVKKFHGIMAKNERGRLSLYLGGRGAITSDLVGRSMLLGTGLLLCLLGEVPLPLVLLGSGRRATSCGFLIFALGLFGRLLTFINIGSRGGFSDGLSDMISGATRLVLERSVELFGSRKASRVVGHRHLFLGRATTGSLYWNRFHHRWSSG